MQLVKNRIVLTKIESVYGTDSVPVVSTDALDCKNVKRNFVADVLQRDNVRGSLSPVQPVIGKHYSEISFDCELKGSGSIGVAGQLSDLLQACSMSETVSAGSSVVYKPTSVSQKSCTIYLYDIDSGSAVLHKLTGCVGTVSLKMTAGAIGILSFSMRGLYNAPADAALPASPTYETSIPPIIESAQFTVNGVSGLVSKEVNIDLANTIAERDDVSQAAGLKAFLVSARQPKGSFPREAALVATDSVLADFVAATARAMTVTIGSASGNKIVITAPKLVVDSVKDGDQSGVLQKDMTFMLAQNTGDDELVINFQ